MSLVLTLGGIRGFRDLAGLMPHLGQSSLWEELNPGVLVPVNSSLEVTAASVLGRTAGFEWGTGFYINPTSPEEATRVLRAVRV